MQRICPAHANVGGRHDVAIEVLARMLLTASCVLALATSLTAQTIDVEFCNGPGELVGIPSQLQFVSGALVSVSQDGNPPFLSGLIGMVNFTTPLFSSGTIENGGVFAAGGSFYIYSFFGISINGTFVKGAWIRSKLPNETYEYVLIPDLRTGGTVTKNLRKGDLCAAREGFLRLLRRG